MTQDIRHEHTGEQVAADSPDRGIWYGLCGYWTDNWAALRKTSIPTCPKCGCPGFITSAKVWFEGAKQFEKEGEDGYCEYLEANKERCFKPSSLMAQWKQHKGNRG